ncbi:hypothetical protein WJX73_002123 [Symbiochloris irregularis]|uniref:Pentatricopeptide repeat-containing protein n=1 Tax=Symbiochloris irregularis TaxID=706552 RepID=A0AAW1P650_9CHLO
MADLQHIAGLLHDSPEAKRGDVSGQRGRATRTEKKLWGGPRFDAGPTPRRGRKRGRSTEAQVTSPSLRDVQEAAQPTVADLTSSWNQPSAAITTSRAWHCEACQVQVPRERQNGADKWALSASWKTHVQGITHRRAALARQHGLKAQDSVISTFEDLGVDSRPHKKDTLRRDDKQVEALHSETLKELLDCAGQAAISGPSGRALSPAMLASARHDMGWQWDRLKPQMHPGLADTILRERRVTSWTLKDLLPAEVAAVADLLPSIQLRELRLSAHMGGRQGLPAAIVALCMLASRIGRTCTVQHLCLELVCTNGEQHNLSRSLLLRLIRALTHMVQCAGSLRLVEVHAPWKSLHIEDGDFRELLDASGTAPARRRCAALSAMCARESSVPSLLQEQTHALPQLPTDLLLEILHRSAPLHQCKVIPGKWKPLKVSARPSASACKSLLYAWRSASASERGLAPFVPRHLLNRSAVSFRLFPPRLHNLSRAPLSSLNTKAAERPNLAQSAVVKAQRPASLQLAAAAQSFLESQKLTRAIRPHLSLRARASRAEFREAQRRAHILLNTAEPLAATEPLTVQVMRGLRAVFLDFSRPSGDRKILVHIHATQGNVIAKSYWADLRALGMPSKQSYTSAMHGWVEGRVYDQVEQLFQEAAADYDPKELESLWLARILAYSRAGRVSDFEQTVASMRAIGFPCLGPKLVGMHMDACCQHGDYTRARRAMEEAKARGLQPDVKMYTMLINCYGKAGKLDQAAAVLDEMSIAGVIPNTRTYSCLMRWHGEAGNAEAVLALWDAMKASHAQLDRSVRWQAVEAVMGSWWQGNRPIALLARAEALNEENSRLPAAVSRCWDHLKRTPEEQDVPKADMQIITGRGPSSSSSASTRSFIRIKLLTRLRNEKTFTTPMQ